MPDYALIEADVVTNVIVVEDGAALPDGSEATADGFVRHLVGSKDNDWQHWRSLAGLDPMPAIGWVLVGGRLVEPETLDAPTQVLPADGSPVELTYTDRRPGAKTATLVINAGEASALPLAKGVGRFTVSAAEAEDIDVGEDVPLRRVTVTVGARSMQLLVASG